MTQTLNFSAWYYKLNRSTPDWEKLPWSERYGRLTAEISCERDPKLYAKHYRFSPVSGGGESGHCTGLEYTSDNLCRAQFYLTRHRNIVRFADLAQLTPSRARLDKVFYTASSWDHPSVWRDAEKNLVWLNEPYPHGTHGNNLLEFSDWCANNGCRSILLPKHIGTYYAGTAVCFLVAPPKSNADIEAMAARLIAGWPA